MSTRWLTTLCYLLTVSYGGVGRAQVATNQSQDPGVRWIHDLEEGRRMAGQTDRLLLVHFWAPWCEPCLRLDKEVFNQPAVGQTLDRQFIPVKLNADHFPSTARRLGVTSLPTDVLMTADGRLIARINSPPTALGYVTQLQQLAWQYRSAQSTATAAGSPPAPTTMPVSVQSSPPAALLGVAQAPQATPGLAQPAYSPQPATAAPIGPAGATTPAWSLSPPGVQAQQPVLPKSPSVPQVPFPHAPTTKPAAPARQAGPSAAPTMGSLLPQRHVDQAAPINHSSIALDGYCPVTLKEQQKWVQGDRRWGAVHRGRTYLFASAEVQQRFFSNPDVYSPVLAGADPVLAIDEGQSVAGQRRHGVFYGGRVYLFASEGSLQRFSRDPQRYAEGVRQAMQQNVGQIPPR